MPNAFAQTMDKNANGDFIVLMPDGSYEDFDDKNPTHKTLMKDFLKKEKEKKKVGKLESKKEVESKKVGKLESKEEESDKLRLKKEKEAQVLAEKKEKNNDKLLQKSKKFFDNEQIKGKLADEAMNKRMKSEYNYKKFLADNSRKKESKEAEKLKKFFEEDKDKEKDSKKAFTVALRDARDARKDLFQAGLDISNFQEYRLEEPKPVIVIANRVEEKAESEKEESEKVRKEESKKVESKKVESDDEEKRESELAQKVAKEEKKKKESKKKDSKKKESEDEDISEDELAQEAAKEEKKKKKESDKALKEEREKVRKKESEKEEKKKKESKKVENEKEEKSKIAKSDDKKTDVKPVLKLKAEQDVMLNPPYPPCVIEFDGLDEFTKIKRKETRKDVLFQHTDDLMLKFYEKNDFLTCSVSGSRTDKGFKYLTFYFLFNSDNVQNTYGVLEKDFVVTLRFLDGEQMPLFNSKTDRGQVDFLKKTTSYKAVIALTETQDKKLFNGEVDQIRVLWGTGTDDYPIYDLDFFSNLMNCIK